MASFKPALELWCQGEGALGEGLREQDTETPPRQRPVWGPLSVAGWGAGEVVRQAGREVGVGSGRR